MTPGSSPSPAAICAIRCLGVAPEAPNAIMCDDTALAPAEVPATTAPAWNRVVIASASRVPPMVDDSRSWLPPVMNTPLASRTTRAAFSSLACDRLTAWSGRTAAAPSSVKIDAIALARLGAHRRGRADDRDLRVATAGERHEPAEDDPIPDLVLRAPNDDDGPMRHGGRSISAAGGRATGRAPWSRLSCRADASPSRRPLVIDRVVRRHDVGAVGPHREQVGVPSASIRAPNRIRVPSGENMPPEMSAPGRAWIRIGVAVTARTRSIRTSCLSSGPGSNGHRAPTRPRC